MQSYEEERRKEVKKEKTLKEKDKKAKAFAEESDRSPTMSPTASEQDFIRDSAGTLLIERSAILREEFPNNFGKFNSTEAILHEIRSLRDEMIRNQTRLLNKLVLLESKLG